MLDRELNQFFPQPRKKRREEGLWRGAERGQRGELEGVGEEGTHLNAEVSCLGVNFLLFPVSATFQKTVQLG